MSTQTRLTLEEEVRVARRVLIYAAITASVMAVVCAFLAGFFLAQ